MIQIAIIGGGVAGAHCASQLAEKGFHPTIFDHSHPREKPCGGLISPLANQLFPFLAKLPINHSQRNKLCIISPRGKKVIVSFKQNRMLTFSRLELDQCLLNQARAKGAELIKEKIINIRRKTQFWKLKTKNQTYQAKIIVGADGVNSIVRQKTIGPLPPKHKGLCFGYFVKGLEKEEITLHFSPYREGYIWMIPRGKQTSIGIGSSKMQFSSGIKMELDAFIQHCFPQANIIKPWAAQIPNIKNTKVFHAPLAGVNWILVGDAAGHVSPRSGEGIIYALLDGEFAAQAIADKKPQTFDQSWKKAYARSFYFDIILGNWVYRRNIAELYCQALAMENIHYR